LGINVKNDNGTSYSHSFSELEGVFFTITNYWGSKYYPSY
jgi:hypothetical protein